MSAEEQTLRHLAIDRLEQERLRDLSDEDLVIEFRSLPNGADEELYITEMCERLYPDMNTEGH